MDDNLRGPEDLELLPSDCAGGGSFVLVGSLAGEDVDLKRKDISLRAFYNNPPGGDSQKPPAGVFELSFENGDELRSDFSSHIETPAGSSSASFALRLEGLAGDDQVIGNCPAEEGRSWLGFDDLDRLKGRFVVRSDDSKCGEDWPAVHLSGCFNGDLD